MDGTDRIRDNARAIRLYITAAQSASNKQLDSYLAKELEWLEGKMQEERLIEQGYNNHYVEVYDRLVNQVLVEKYGRVQRLSMAAAFLGVADEQISRRRRVSGRAIIAGIPTTATRSLHILTR